MKSFFAQLRSLVLPFGATSGQRIILDGVNGTITVYDASNSPAVVIDLNGVEVIAADGTSATLKAVDFGRLLLGPANPVGITFDPAALYATESGATDHRPTLTIASPDNQALIGAQAIIYLTGKGVTTAQNTIELAADVIIAGGVNLGRGVIGGKYYTGGDRSVGIAGVESLANMDTGAVTMKAGRLYHILVKLKTTAGITNDSYAFRVRDTNVSGTLRGEYVWTAPSTAFGYGHALLAFQYIPAVDETKTFVLTGQRVGGTGSVNINTGGTSNSVYMAVEDKGIGTVMTLVP